GRTAGASDRTGCAGVERTREGLQSGRLPAFEGLGAALSDSRQVSLSLAFGVLYLECGPQDSNLQPRDSRALVFPRGLDYLILLGEAVVVRGRTRPDDSAPEEAGRS